MVIGTHGRGIYCLNLNPIHQAYQLSTKGKKQYHLFEIPDAQYPKQVDTNREVDKSTITLLPISFWTPRKSRVKMLIKDINNEELIWEKNIKAKKGLNQFRWDLVTKTEHSNLPYFVDYKKYIQPGAYTFYLKTPQKIILQNFIIKEWVY